jgi:hypothetical protein
MLGGNMLNGNYDPTVFIYFLLIVILAALAKIIGEQYSKLEKLRHSLGPETYNWILGTPLINTEKDYSDISEFLFRTKLRILYQVYKIKKFHTSFERQFTREL